MTQTLATLTPSQRAPYIRIQSSTRSAFHKSVSARRIAEFRAHLTATQPGGSLPAHCRIDPRSSTARKGPVPYPFISSRRPSYPLTSQSVTCASVNLSVAGAIRASQVLSHSFKRVCHSQSLSDRHPLLILVSGSLGSHASPSHP
jgi:hypothetical protein